MTQTCKNQRQSAKSRRFVVYIRTFIPLPASPRRSIPSPSNQSTKNTKKKGRMSQPISRILYQLQKQPAAIIHLVAAIADCL